MDLVKSRNDAKEYRLLSLESGLEVMLVSTVHCRVSSNKAAAAVAVQAGSFADPLEVQGLAHFVEHMVFMGSKAYPIENYYDAYIHSHGGECNAMTEGEYTVYQFNISNEYLSPALDIFANCLLHPLFSANSMERELNAIESEFSLALADDGARLQQLLGACAKEGHVLKKFSWGNEYSLKTVPEQHKVDVHSYLTKFHNTHYLPGNMKLVIIAGKALDELEASLMQSTFARLVTPTSPPPLPTQQEMLQSMGLPLPSSAFKKVFRIIPTRKTHKLLVSWQLRSILKDYRSKSTQYLCHLIGHEGPGSLLSELKRVGFSSGVSAGVSDGSMDNNSMFAIFNITITLTPKGLANWFQVVALLFAYLHMLHRNGPQEWVYQELRDMAEIDFSYLDEEEEDIFAERVAVEMLPYRARDRNHLLYANYTFAQFDPHEISDLQTSLMDPLAARIEILSSSYYIPGRVEVEAEDPETEWEDVNDDDTEDMEGDYEESEDGDEEDEDDSLFNVGASEYEESDEEMIDGGNGIQNVTPDDLKQMYQGPQHLLHLVLPPTDDKLSKKVTPEVEPYFGTLYWIDDIPEELLLEWSHPTLCSRLHLPPRNHFIPYDFMLVDCSRVRDAREESSKTEDHRVKGIFSVFDVSAASTLPMKLFDKAEFTAWHIVHPVHRTPKVEIYFSFISSIPIKSPLSATANDLFVRVVTDCLAETTYMASMAEIHSNIICTDTGFTIHLSGFSDKSLVLLRSIIDALTDKVNTITQERVERQADLLLRAYENENMKASKSAANARLSALKPSKYSADRKSTHLKQILENRMTLIDEMFSFTTSFFANASVTALIAGNISTDASMRCIEDVFLLFGQRDIMLSAQSRPFQPIVNIPVNRPFLLRVMPNNIKEKNTCVELYFQQGPFDMHRLTMLDLLDQIISEPYFDDLRTKQQLGYHVECGVRQTYGVLGYCFVVVTSSHSAEEVQNAVLKFASSAADFLMNYPDEGFLNNLNALRDHFLQPHPSLAIAARDIWTEVEERRYAFNHATMQAALLSTIKKEELAAFAYSLFCSEKKLLVIHSSVEDDATEQECAEIKSTFDIIEKAEDLHQIGTYDAFM